MKKIFAIILALSLTVGMFTACGKIEDDVSDVSSVANNANNDSSKSEKVDSIASQDSNDDLLTENNQTAENLYYVIQKAAVDLSEGNFGTITAKKKVPAGEYRISIDSSAELPYSLTYAVDDDFLTEEEATQFLTYAVKDCGIPSGEILVRVTDKYNVRAELYPTTLGNNSSFGLSYFTPYTNSDYSSRYIYKVYYSDNTESNYVGCNYPMFETVSDFTIDDIPSEIKSSGRELKEKNRIIAEYLSDAIRSSLRDIQYEHFEEIAGAKDITVGEYRISLSDTTVNSINLSDDDINSNILSEDSVKNLIIYLATNESRLSSYVPCKAITNGEMIIRIRKCTTIDHNRNSSCNYECEVYYADSVDSKYTGYSRSENLDDSYSIDNIPENTKLYEYEVDYSVACTTAAY